jgi:UDP-2,4-diacetamido-2,4,6-trideoxy-beta-L-altropyranose hydrolase
MPRTPSICIRADSSEQIGTGHVMRDLVLAQAFRRRGFNVEFLCRTAQGDLTEAVESSRFRVHRMSGSSHNVLSDAKEAGQILDAEQSHFDWLVVDHYGLDSQWESSMRTYADRIFVIDDLANRPHDCDVLLDQNLYNDMQHRYDNLIPNDCKRLLGPSYALLRQEFVQQGSAARPRKSIQQILLSMGGADAGNETSKALEAISAAARADIVTDVIVGSANTHSDQLRTMSAALSHVNFHVAPKNMVELMVAADVAVGAGGISLWERSYLGLPSIAVAIADNQIEQLKAADSAGCIIYLGQGDAVSAEKIGLALRTLIDNPTQLHEMSRACLQLMSSHKGEQELLEAILGTTA